MRNLQLSLKKQWFDLTKSGVKTEDYRDITPYWFKRLFETIIDDNSIEQSLEYILEGYDLDFINNICGYQPKQFITNIMTLGYPKSTNTDRILKLEHKGIEIDYGKQEWGAEPGKRYFIIKHGKEI